MRFNHRRADRAVTQKQHCSLVLLVRGQTHRSSAQACRFAESRAERRLISILMPPARI